MIYKRVVNKNKLRKEHKCIKYSLEKGLLKFKIHKY